jgi:hypothetical protein
MMLSKMVPCMQQAELFRHPRQWVSFHNLDKFCTINCLEHGTVVS